MQAMVEIYSEPILSHSVLVYDRRTNQNGSGVLVDLGGRVFVLTAAHVVEDGDILISMGFPGQQEPFSILNRETDSGLDLGFLELSPFEVELRRGNHIQPYKIRGQQQQSARSLATTFALCGFPTEHIIADGNVRKPTPVLVWCALMHRSQWPQFIVDRGKTPEDNFVVLYGARDGRSFFDPDGKEIHPFSPYGMSGCGLWYFDPSAQSVDQALYSLVGVQTSYVKAEKLLIGTFVDKIVNRISSRYQISLKQIE
jgi:hypothetical protein